MNEPWQTALDAWYLSTLPLPYIRISKPTCPIVALGYLEKKRGSVRVWCTPEYHETVGNCPGCGMPENAWMAYVCNRQHWDGRSQKQVTKDKATVRLAERKLRRATERARVRAERVKAKASA